MFPLLQLFGFLLVWSAATVTATMKLSSYQTLQQRVLCDLATNLPDLTSASFYLWQCKSNQTNSQICSGGSTSWLGISCDVHSNVTSISVSGLVTLGSIPTSIGQLTSLSKLMLYSSSVSGRLPSSLGYLTRLATLGIYTNLNTGPIPTSIGSLTKLASLQFKNNLLSGPLPLVISKLTLLSDLRLHQNSLTGEMPSFVGTLTRLKMLTFNQNCFTGTLPSSFGNLALVTFLNFHINALTGTLPSSLGSLKSCVDFFLDENNFNGSIPSSYGGLTAVQYIQLYGNVLTGTIPSSLGKLTALITFDFHGNCLTGSIPTSLGSMKLLQGLYFENNLLSKSIPSALGNMAALKVLQLNNNRLTGSLPTSLSKLIVLTTLDVAQNYLTGTLPTSLCSLSALNGIYVANNSLSCYSSCFAAPLDDSLAQYSICGGGAQESAMCELATVFGVNEALSHHFTTVTTSVDSLSAGTLNGYTEVQTISTPSATEYVIVFDSYTNTANTGRVYICADYACTHTLGMWYGNSTQFPGTSSARKPFHVQNSTFYIKYTVSLSYVTIAVNGNKVGVLGTGYKLKVYAKCATALLGWKCNGSSPLSLYSDWYGVTTADGLHVSGISLTGIDIKATLPACLGNLSSVNTLSLGSNQLYGTVPGNTLSKMTSLEVLDLSSNYLTGTIPTALGLLSSLVTLKLSANSLAGSIPTVLGDLTVLSEFYLASNELTGVLPSELCSAAQLMTLDIQHNPEITCYQSNCWGDLSYRFGDIAYCAPTSQPTSQPTTPSSMPTSAPTRGVKILQSASSSSSGLQAGVVGGICAAVAVCIILGFLASSKNKLQLQIEQHILLNNSLPLHKAILEIDGGSSCSSSSLSTSSSSSHILELLEDSSIAATGKLKDKYGRTALKAAMEQEHTEDSVIKALLLRCLPYNPVTLEEIPPEEHAYGWTDVIQHGHYKDLVGEIIDEHMDLAILLRDAKDRDNRAAIDIAAPECKLAILLRGYFFRRYEILTSKHPHYRSETCVVHIAIDHDDDKKRVALKFMRNRDEFTREVRIRAGGSFDPKYVIDILRVHDSDEDSKFANELVKKGFGESPFLVVMEAAERSLQDIMSKEHFAGRDYSTIRLLFSQVVSCVSEMHGKGYIHGDLKPLNIVRSGHLLKLIDLDGSARPNEDYSCLKYTTGFLPPELIYETEDVVCVRAVAAVAVLPQSQSGTMVSNLSLCSSHDSPSRSVSNSVKSTPRSSLVIGGGAGSNMASGTTTTVTTTTVSSTSTSSSHSSRGSTTAGIPLSRGGSFWGWRVSTNDEHVAGGGVGVLEKNSIYRVFSESTRSRRRKDVSSNISTMVLEALDENDEDNNDKVLEEGGGGSGGINYDLVLASVSHDMWSLGVLLFIMCVNVPLFLSDSEGNIAEEKDMRLLARWSDELKAQKCSLLNDRYARNLISLLLSKDPKKRPNTKQVLLHPFVTGKKTIRLASDKAEFDVFLSYRYASDAATCELLYDLLVAAGIKVWWDRKCLKPGEPWEEGFCTGMSKSRIFVPILSRAAINHPAVAAQNFQLLTCDSPCDNVFLEHRLAMELRDRELIQKIFPVFIGDCRQVLEEEEEESEQEERRHRGHRYHTRYTFRGDNPSHPTCPDLAVTSVEVKLTENLDRLGLGSPYNQQQTVSEVMEQLTAYQGGFVEGALVPALQALVAIIKGMAST